MTEVRDFDRTPENKGSLAQVINMARQALSVSSKLELFSFVCGLGPTFVGQFDVGRQLYYLDRTSSCDKNKI